MIRLLLYLVVLPILIVPCIAAADLAVPADRITALMLIKPESLPSLEEKAESGDGESMGLLGEVFAFGFAGVEIDEARAVVWLRKAAGAGQAWASDEADGHDLHAQHEGLIVHISAVMERARAAFASDPGTSSDVDPDLVSLADSGFEDAQILLGSMKASGRGAPQDMAEAIHLWSLAATQGSAAAHVLLGDAFLAGRGAVQDRVAAAAHYAHAAEQGDGKAQMAVGMMLIRGDGVSQDDVEGLKWLALAAAGGVDSARDAFSLVAAPMLGQDVNEALARAGDWLRSNKPSR